MNKPYQTLGIVLSLILLSSCKELPPKNATETKSCLTVGQPHVSPNQIVVEFPDNIVDREAEREKYHVIKYDTCSCGDNNKELWTLDLSKISVEGALSNMEKEDPDGSGMDGDYQIVFEVPTPKNDTLTKISIVPPLRYTEPTHTSDRINIAILDSGILPNYFNDDTQFLYNTEGKFDCPSNFGQVAKSGWNFIDHNSDVTDYNGHGTYITNIIVTELDDEFKDKYRILPLKVFDKEGLGSYWRIVCAMDYVKKLGDISIINASFGYYGNIGDQKILKKLIDEMQANTIVLASAGNLDTVDTDVPGNEHSPSGFTSDNIIAVGGYVLDSTNTTGEPINDGNGKISGINIKGSSGVTSVDLAAPFDGYIMSLINLANGNNTQPIKISPVGTSYGTALMTARVAKLMATNPNQPNGIQEYKKLVLNSSLQSSELIEFVDQGRVVLRNMP